MSMNLHSLVRGMVTTVNSDETVVLSVSSGYIQHPEGDGTQIPTYNNYPMLAQIQALSGRDLRQIEGLNLNGILRAVYFQGDVQAIVRRAQRGGDIMTRADGSQWLVTQVLETWPGWSKVIVTLQNTGVS